MRSSIAERLKRAAAAPIGDPGGAPPAGVDPTGGAAPPGAPPMADPSGGAPMPGVAPEAPIEPPAAPMGQMGGQMGGQPGMMMQPQAPKVKIDPGTVIIQCVRMMTKVLEKVQGDQSNDMVDPGVIKAALDQSQASMSTLVQQGEGGKAKVDINNGLVIIQKLTAALLDAMGIPMPASHMVATPDEMMGQGPQMGMQSGDPSGMDPNAAAGGQPAPANPGIPADPLQPIDPLQAGGGAAPKTAGERPYVEDGVALPRPSFVPLPQQLNQSVLQRIRNLRR